MNSESFAIEFRSWILIAIVLWVAINDLKHYRISNRSVLFTLLAGLSLSVSLGHLNGLRQSIYGILVGFLLLIILYALGGVTAGDVKWLAALGAWYGPKGIVGVFLVSGAILGLLSLAWVAYCRLTPSKRDVDLKPDIARETEPLSKAQNRDTISQKDNIDEVYQSNNRRRRMIPYAVPVALGVVLIESFKIIANHSGELLSR